MNIFVNVCLLSLALISASYVRAESDPLCRPIIKASEARIAQPSWHSVTVLTASHYKKEFLKTGGKFYMRTNEGPWTTAPFNFDDTERQFLAQVSEGTVKLTQCRNSGAERVDGAVVSAISYKVEMGSMAEESRLLIGKADGLPYEQASNKVKVSYRYKNIVAPIPGSH